MWDNDLKNNDLVAASQTTAFVNIGDVLANWSLQINRSNRKLATAWDNVVLEIHICLSLLKSVKWNCLILDLFK